VSESRLRYLHSYRLNQKTNVKKPLCINSEFAQSHLGMALLNFGWVSDMRVESRKVKLACDEEDHGSHGIEPVTETS
jgi:hypothetical protein